MERHRVGRISNGKEKKGISTIHNAAWLMALPFRVTHSTNIRLAQQGWLDIDELDRNESYIVEQRKICVTSWYVPQIGNTVAWRGINFISPLCGVLPSNEQYQSSGWLNGPVSTTNCQQNRTLDSRSLDGPFETNFLIFSFNLVRRRNRGREVSENAISMQHSNRYPRVSVKLKTFRLLTTEFI